MAGLGLREFVNLEPRILDERASVCRLNYGLKRLDFDRQTFFYKADLERNGKLRKQEAGIIWQQ